MLIKKPSKVIEHLKNAVRNSSMDVAIKASHTLSGLSDMEKQFYDVSDNAVSITKWNPNINTYVETMDGVWMR
jgi:hypothetical protein